ncbi:PREDICTED: probable xyloglucan galactosyltransferase GT12 [Lupinus angustifolius]|uniref:probable xyloglucan galactosyltransferase GT12 n=1 Tax=Lupinus angustifolius TaxID=3871 RepID=UPI00092E5B3C|nr:PREDICTED: probable xyloglucan galactosyltransferase GT12 [Lupinus angustifolius]
MKKPPLKKFYDLIWFVLLTTFVLYISMLLLNYYKPLSNYRISFLFLNNHTQVQKPSNPCSGKYIYAYDLPSIFNEDLVKGCKSLNKWFDMCPYLSNLGLGKRVIEKTKRKVLLKNSWYVTNQFSLEVIFHQIMKDYKCLTNDSSIASAIYVPYYAGLDVGQYLWEYNVTMRDSTPKKLANWLGEQVEWKKMLGKDHFMVGGRIGFDFRRRTENSSDWGTKLMFLAETSNMSFLPLETSTYENDFPIPYPTYFHPSKDKEIHHWQERMRRMKRTNLFSFAGAPRPNSTYSIRSVLIQHCQSYNKSCKLLNCYVNNQNKCDDPVHVMKVFQSSVFCLQPPGDSYTRRSTFDSILGGCIPVFFNQNSAYKQYLWHLPKNGSTYSVFISEEDVKRNRTIIHDTLSSFSKKQVLAMREEVIRIIPRISYRKPGSRLEIIEDAFDVAVKSVLERIEGIRRKEFL